MSERAHLLPHHVITETCGSRTHPHTFSLICTHTHTNTHTHTQCTSIWGILVWCYPSFGCVNWIPPHPPLYGKIPIKSCFCCPCICCSFTLCNVNVQCAVQYIDGLIISCKGEWGGSLPHGWTPSGKVPNFAESEKDHKKWTKDQGTERQLDEPQNCISSTVTEVKVNFLFSWLENEDVMGYVMIFNGVTS